VGVEGETDPVITGPLLIVLAIAVFACFGIGLYYLLVETCSTTGGFQIGQYYYQRQTCNRDVGRAFLFMMTGVVLAGFLERAWKRRTMTLPTKEEGK